MNRRASSLPTAHILALLVPSLLLGGALISQYVGGLYPCEMCWWQRWLHMAAIALAVLALLLRSNTTMSRVLVILAIIAIAISGAIGAFHAGVEYGWWEGLTACSVTTKAQSASDMLDAIMAAPLTRCDTAPWTLAGISLAGFNAIFSLGAAALIGMLLRAKKD